MSGFISGWRLLSLAGACLAVLLCASPGYAQGVVQGTVVDAKNQPVEGALVTITSKDSSRKFQLKTDKKGEFFQIGVPSGAYTVTVEKDKLKASQDTQASQGRPARLNLVLAPGAGLTEEEKAKSSALQKIIDEGAAAVKAGDHQTAIAKYTEVAAAIPTCADCYDTIGREQMALKNYAEAEAAFKKAIELKPDHADAYNGLANLYNAQKKFDLAAQASAKATELGGAAAGAGGGSADSLYNQGVIAWNAGKPEEARGHFEAALKVDPNHAPAHYQLGMALVNAGKLAEARGEFETYLKLAPTGQYADQAKSILAAIPK
jgi:tetratricopeptide (TPR) repeat protein